MEEIYSNVERGEICNVEVVERAFGDMKKNDIIKHVR